MQAEIGMLQVSNEADKDSDNWLVQLALCPLKKTNTRPA
jgi:hypothetical protein